MLKPEKIIEIVYDYFDTDLGLVESKRRYRHILKPRYISIYFISRYTTMTYEQISWRFGYGPPSGHCMAMHAKKVVANRRDTEQEYKEDLIVLDEKFKEMYKEERANRLLEDEVFQQNDMFL